MLSVDKRKALLASGTDTKIRKALNGSLSRDGLMSLKGLGLTVVPDLIAEYAERVETLDLSDNQLKDLPEAVGALWGLERLVLTKNKWKGFPKVIFNLHNLREVVGAPGFARGARRSELEAFLRHTGNLEPEHRRTLFAIVVGSELAQFTNAQLASGLIGTLESLCTRCTDALLARSAKVPLEAGARVTIVGSVRFKKTEFKKAATGAGISYSPKPTAETTHVVLGRSPKEVSLVHLNRKRITFMREGDALGFMDEVQADTRFLTQPTPEAAAHGENIRAMLSSGEKASVDLALTLISKGGLPLEAASALFLMAKEGEDKKQRAKARKLLKRHGSDDVKAALANRSAMAYSGSKAEAHTTGSLGSYATQAPELDWIWMARELYKRYGHGLRYVLQNADHATRLEVLRGQIDRGSLNFHSVWSPRSRPYYENVYAYYTGIAVPSYLYELTELTELNLSWCHFDSLPPGLSALAKLRKLDLSGNMLTALPDELWTLTELRELRIGVNQLAAFPKKVTALPNLKLLDLRGNRRRDAKHLYEPLSVPPNVRKAMPHCRFLDGLTPQQQRHMSYHT